MFQSTNQIHLLVGFPKIFRQTIQTWIWHDMAISQKCGTQTVPIQS